MKLLRLFLTLALVAGLAGVAIVAQENEPPGIKMANAANKFLDSLTEEQKPKATFSFDSMERSNWYFTPKQKGKDPARNGLALEQMNETQKKAALGLVAAGTSPDGAKKAITIMSLEAILRDLEKGGAMVRNPEWYFFTIFGTPSKTGKWGWRVEGHHLSLNFVVDEGKVTAATPAFFGANPATVKQGKLKGQRTLPQAEDLAIELFKALDEDQQQAAYQKDPFPEIKEGTPKPPAGEPRGIAAAKLNEKQRSILLELIRSYATRMPAEVADAQMAQVKAGGIDKIHFAFTGGTAEGQPHTYRIQGPTFLIEFLNVQPDSAGNPANHIHSAWRNLKGDFGLAGEGS